MTQRLGRIKRQGNRNQKVEIYRYVTEKTFDAYSYQLIENKQKFIAQIMTSKSPVRSAEDVDEQALSYAEIKALATGNPLIIEKCDLEMQVGRLKLIKSSFLSQRYGLEDKLLKYFPAEIKRLTERIAGFEHDIAHLAEQPQPQDGAFIAMVVNGVAYSERKVAGNAVLEACKAMTNPAPIPLGEYRGFPMELSYSVATREYAITLKGQLSHFVTIGTDAVGIITRLDNTIAGFPERLAQCRVLLEEVAAQREKAKAEVEKPFPQEAELAAKTVRLNEVNIALNLDERDREIVDDVPDEGEGAEQPERKRYSRDAR